MTLNILCVLCASGFLLRVGLGAIFPPVVNVVEGAEVMLRLTWSNKQQTKCNVKVPNTTIALLHSHMFIDEFNSHSCNRKCDRICFWIGNTTVDDNCGVRIRNVTMKDSGFWHLLSMTNNETKVLGATKITIFPLNEITEQHEVLLGTKELKVSGKIIDEYCSHLYWNISTQFHYNHKVDVYINQSDSMIFGWELIKCNTEHRLNIFCNSRERVKSCHFVHLKDEVEYLMIDGIGDGKHSYFGDGYCSGQCGMTIEEPDLHDFTMWQCLLVTRERKYPLSSFIFPQQMDHIMRANSYMDVLTWDDGGSVVMQGSKLSVQCRAGARLSKCVFLHPNNITIEPFLGNTKEKRWKYIGLGLMAGECGIITDDSELSDSGHWLCRMELEDTGKLIEKIIKVRVAESPVFAESRYIESYKGKLEVLKCHIFENCYNGDLCEFYAPNGSIFIVNTKLLTNHCYCEFTIINVQHTDFGNWSCNSHINGKKELKYDVILIADKERFVAAVDAGVVFGVLIIIAIALILYYAIQYYKKNITRQASFELREISQNM